MLRNAFTSTRFIRTGPQIESRDFDGHRVDVRVPNQITPETPILLIHDGMNVFFSKFASSGDTWRIREAIDEKRLGKRYFICFTKCDACIFGYHCDPPIAHTWAEPDEIEAVVQEQHLTVVFVTHNMREAVRLGDRVILMGSRPGRIVYETDIDLPHPRQMDSAGVAERAADLTVRLKAGRSHLEGADS